MYYVKRKFQFFKLLSYQTYPIYVLCKGLSHPYMCDLEPKHLLPWKNIKENIGEVFPHVIYNTSTFWPKVCTHTTDHTYKW